MGQWVVTCLSGLYLVHISFSSETFMKLMWVDITIMSFSQLQKISAPASNKEISGG